MVPGVYAFQMIVLFNRGQMLDALQASASPWRWLGRRTLYQPKVGQANGWFSKPAPQFSILLRPSKSSNILLFAITQSSAYYCKLNWISSFVN